MEHRVITGQFVAMAASRSTSPAVELELGDRLVRISHPDRVYFPARGETKLDPANYYQSVGSRRSRTWHADEPCVTELCVTELGAVGWPKTSGGSGLHIFVWIEPRWGFAGVRRAALALAREMERGSPRDVTTTLGDLHTHLG